jgi:hypothetical protein
MIPDTNQMYFIKESENEKGTEMLEQLMVPKLGWISEGSTPEQRKHQRSPENIQQESMAISTI